jgi:fructoselysine 6-kinase
MTIESPKKTYSAIVGDNTIDRYLGLHSIEFVGGNALNVAAQLGLAGDEVAYFGAVGDDAAGRLITSRLAEIAVDLSGLVVAEGDTAVTEIRLTEGDRYFEREDFGVTADYFPGGDELRRIAEARWVHIGMLPRASELRGILRALNPGLTISQDCAVAQGYTDLDVAFESAGEDREAATATAIAAVGAGAGLAVVTRGADGAIAHDGDRWWEQDALPIDVVDTTGAGDSFIAGFLSARLTGRDVRQAMEQGARWAAATCQHVAGFPQPSV